MARIPDLFQKYRRLAAWLKPMQIPLHSARTCFFLVLSLFPSLLLLLGLLRGILGSGGRSSSGGGGGSPDIDIEIIAEIGIDTDSCIVHNLYNVLDII